jgi:hypothetical protein
LNRGCVGGAAADDAAAASTGAGTTVGAGFFVGFRSGFAFGAFLVVGGFLFFFFAFFAFFALELDLAGGDARGSGGRRAQDDAFERQRPTIFDREQPRVTVVFVLERRQRAGLGDQRDALSGGDLEAFGKLVGRRFLGDRYLSLPSSTTNPAQCPTTS